MARAKVDLAKVDLAKVDLAKAARVPMALVPAALRVADLVGADLMVILAAHGLEVRTVDLVVDPADLMVPMVLVAVDQDVVRARVDLEALMDPVDVVPARADLDGVVLDLAVPVSPVIVDLVVLAELNSGSIRSTTSSIKFCARLSRSSTITTTARAPFPDGHRVARSAVEEVVVDSAHQVWVDPECVDLVPVDPAWVAREWDVPVLDRPVAAGILVDLLAWGDVDPDLVDLPVDTRKVGRSVDLTAVPMVTLVADPMAIPAVVIAVVRRAAGPMVGRVVAATVGQIVDLPVTVPMIAAGIAAAETKTNRSNQ